MVDSQCHLSLNFSETKHTMNKLTMDITIASKVLMNKPKHITIPL